MLKTHLMVARLGFSSPQIGHPITYGEFVMDKLTKVENMQKRYLSTGSPVSKSFFLED